jgi:hypothetical protein
MRQPAHLFVDISAHGFGHLAQAAPVLNALSKRLPELRLTIRSGLPTDKLQARVMADFTHLQERSDFGYVMHDAVSLDLEATALAYRRQHADWDRLVDRDARLFRELQPNLVFSDVAYLPLAGAARAGIPSVSMCSLNWAELFAHFFASEDWAAAIHRQMLDAYAGAECFLRATPGMAMADLPRLRPIGPLAALGNDCRQAPARTAGQRQGRAPGPDRFWRLRQAVAHCCLASDPRRTLPDSTGLAAHTSERQRLSSLSGYRSPMSCVR